MSSPVPQPSSRSALPGSEVPRQRGVHARARRRDQRVRGRRKQRVVPRGERVERVRAAAEGPHIAEYTRHPARERAGRTILMGRVLFAHGHLLRFDRKQFAIGKPYPPLATITAAAYLRALGHEVALYDPTLDEDTRGFAAALERARPHVLVVIYDDVFNWFTKMCLGAHARGGAGDDPPGARRRGARGRLGSRRRRRARGLSDGRRGRSSSSARARSRWASWRAGRQRVRRATRRAGDRRATDALDDIPGLGLHGPRHAAQDGTARAAQGAGPAAPGRLGSGRRRALPRVLAAAPRLLLAERRHDARLSLPVQLVREAGLRQHLPHALARERGRRDAPPARALRARPPLVLRRHLRAQDALADAVRRARSPPRDWPRPSSARRAPI